MGVTGIGCLVFWQWCQSKKCPVIIAGQVGIEPPVQATFWPRSDIYHVEHHGPDQNFAAGVFCMQFFLGGRAFSGLNLGSLGLLLLQLQFQTGDALVYGGHGHSPAEIVFVLYSNLGDDGN